jgi:hypothetical protein
MKEIFESAVRTNGDLAGVFEFEGKISYFYLMQTSNADSQKIIGAIRICADHPDFEAKDVLVKWDEEEEYVGLMIRGELWAAFDGHGAKFGGDYKRGGTANISKEVLREFQGHNTN